MEVARIMPEQRRVLILCTGNSCRSQMAEGLWRHLGGDAWDVHSAGSRPTGAVHPLAVRAMAERGLDISQQESKSLAPYAEQPFDVVVTVCDSAAQDCPAFSRAAQRLHWSTDDPAAVDGTETQQMASFARVRDELAERIRTFLASD